MRTGSFLPEEGGHSSPPAEQAQAIKIWTRQLLGLSDETWVTVHELPCADPGCPLLVTTIVVHETPVRTWRFERPKAAITKLMLQHVLLAS